MAVNWESGDLLLGECKWTGETVNREIVRDLVEVKTPKVLADLAATGVHWRVHPALFAGRGFTEAARQEGERLGALLVDLPQMDGDFALMAAG